MEQQMMSKQHHIKEQKQEFVIKAQPLKFETGSQKTGFYRLDDLSLLKSAERS